MNDIVSQQKQQIEEVLNSTVNIGVVLSSHQSMDAVAAALSMSLILQDSGKKSQVVSKKEPIVEYSTLVGIDQLHQNFSGSTKLLTVSFPYKDGEIEKVSYNIEGDRLNVNLFAETNGITFQEKDIKYIYQGSTPQVVIAIGVSDHAELAGIVDPSTTKIINIDTNMNNSLYGDVVLVDASYSSLSEIVARLSEVLNLQVEFDVAQNLLDGIMSATSNFSSPKTSPLAFEMTGVLMQKGAVRRAQKQERSADTSLQMLGQKPQGQNFPKPFGNTQDKQFGGQQFSQNAQKPFPKNQNKPFVKQFGGQQPKPNFPKKQYFEEVNNPTMDDQFEEAQGFTPQAPFAPRPKQTQDFSQEENFATPQHADRMEEIKSQLKSMPAPRVEEAQVEEPQVPTEDQAPSDWFTPKVFKSNKN